jgi:hypothetical protein
MSAVGRGLRRSLALAVGSALLAASPPATTAAPTCLPPGVTREVLSWPTANAQAVAFPTESGGRRAGLLELYQSPEGRSVVLVWVQGDIVYVDTAPQDPQSPGWIDLGFMTLNGKTLLDRPTAPCQWRIVNGTDV